MPLIDLSQLQCGDVILHSGIDKIADNTGEPGRFGHALLVLNRLLYVHAPGPGKTAKIEPFDLAEWLNEQDRIIGPEYKKDACVLRPKFLVDEAAILSEVQLECGTEYADISKLKELEDLGGQLKEMLLTDERLVRLLRNASPEGRSCGELVASLLFKDKSNLTPNGLYSSGRFDNLVELVHSDGNFSKVGPNEHKESVNELFSAYDNKISKDIWSELVREAQNFKNNPDGSMEDFADRYRRLINGRLEINLRTIVDVGKYAGVVFGF